MTADQFLELADRVISQRSFRQQLYDDPKAALRSVLHVEADVTVFGGDTDHWCGGLMR